MTPTDDKQPDIKETLQALLQRATTYGFDVQPDQEFEQASKAKPRSHDDGPRNGPFMGGLGNPMFSRSIDGQFDRWQLEPGVHLHEAIEPAFLAVRWVENGEAYMLKLRVGNGKHDIPQTNRRYAALFPVVFEQWQSDQLPADITITIFSPQLPGDSATSALPTTLFNVALQHWKANVTRISIALFWPNLMGWSMMPLTSSERAGKHWPNQTHAGQCNHLVQKTEQRCHLAHRQQKFDQTVNASEIGISAETDTGKLSYQLTVKANQNETGIPYSQQPYTLSWLEQQWLETGHLTNDDTQWPAHWHEPLLSALSCEFTTAGKVTFAITFDFPQVQFSQGRRWWRKYTNAFGRDGRQSANISNLAFNNLTRWLSKLNEWQQNSLLEQVGHGRTWTDKTAGAVINENWSISAGSAVWVDGPINPETAAQNPFRTNEHFGWLEGFDSGYFYYNTLDLYVYAFPALSRTWPDLAQSIFDDYLDSAQLVQPKVRPVYRTGELATMLIAGKLPHDLGSPAEDPWVTLNGYVMRDDPNVWKDHNPSFIVSYYLHRELISKAIVKQDMANLEALADFIKTQLDPDLALPIHQEFGDSTWDNLDMRGLSSYSASWVLAAWAVLAKLWREQGREQKAASYSALLSKAQTGFEQLWADGFYRTNSEGKYRNATQCDSLMGVFYARLAGLGDLLPMSQIRSHLSVIWENNVEAFHQGKFGPLLVAEAGRQRYGRDGGEELQVNEVLVGSAWVFVAMLAEYGFKDKARTLADNMVEHQYARSGLQFRTPAAWDGDAQFRAPINMRPLSIAWLQVAGLAKKKE